MPPPEKEQDIRLPVLWPSHRILLREKREVRRKTKRRTVEDSLTSDVSRLTSLRPSFQGSQERLGGHRFLQLFLGHDFLFEQDLPDPHAARDGFLEDLGGFRV